MIPLQVDLALLIGPLLLRADISFHSASCPAQAADGSRGFAYFVLGFVKLEAGIARIIACPDGLARGSEQLGGGGEMCHARAWINWWRRLSCCFQSTSSESDVTARNVRSRSGTLCTVISARPSHYEVPLNEIGHLFNLAGLFEN